MVWFGDLFILHSHYPKYAGVFASRHHKPLDILASRDNGTSEMLRLDLVPNIYCEKRRVTREQDEPICCRSALMKESPEFCG